MTASEVDEYFAGEIVSEIRHEYVLIEQGFVEVEVLRRGVEWQLSYYGLVGVGGFVSTSGGCL